MTQEIYNAMLGGRGKDLYSTGSYGKDVGVGLLSGLNYAFNKPGKYYVKANWAGNGLANTGLGYMENPNYSNPYDAMNALTSSMYNGKSQEEEPDTFESMQERLSTMLGQPLFGNRGNQREYALKTQEYQLPQVGNVGGGSIGGYGDIYNQQEYRLPTQEYTFNKFWE